MGNKPPIESCLQSPGYRTTIFNGFLKSANHEKEILEMTTEAGRFLVVDWYVHVKNKETYIVTVRFD